MILSELNKLPSLRRFTYWISERHQIYLRKSRGLPTPWTDDPILQQFRFCNVYRELDKVTVWIRKNWRDPNNENPDLWFAMVMARLFNLPSTLEDLGYPTRWNMGEFLCDAHRLKDKGRPIFNGAYIVSTNGKKMDKLDYLAEYVLDPLWQDRKEVRPRVGDTLRSFCNRLTKYDGLGTFMAGQVVCDVKYATGSPLRKAEDWWTYAAPGPGSKRGLNRLLGNPIDQPWGTRWENELAALQRQVTHLLPKMPRIHAQDLQNCLCEFDKMERVRTGEGKPKQKYQGT